MITPKKQGTAAIRLLPRILLFPAGVFLLLLNQRWDFVYDTANPYGSIFVWHYLDRLPELLAYCTSLLINLIAATLIAHPLFTKAPRRRSDEKQIHR